MINYEKADDGEGGTKQKKGPRAKRFFEDDESAFVISTPAATEEQPAVEEPEVTEPLAGKGFKHGSHDQSTHGHGGGGTDEEKPTARQSKVKEQSPSPKTKSEIAKASAKRVDSEIQRYAEDVNEAYLAEKLGGTPLPDNEPPDVVAEIDGKKHGIEVKTMVDNSARKITCKSDAQARKRTWERKNKGTFHTVVIDDHLVFNAKGPGKHDLSKRELWYRRGSGSFRVDGMAKVRDYDHLKELITMDKRKLPKGAKQAEEGGAL